MKFTTERNTLLAALTAASGAVDKKGLIPLYGHIRMTCEGDTLSILATNGDTRSDGSISVEGGTDGVCLAPAQAVTEIVKRLPPSDVTVSHDGSDLVVKSGRSRFKLPTLPAAEFSAGLGDAADMIEVAGKDLASAFGCVGFAASTESTKYYLMGVFLDTYGETVTMAATNGHKMAVFDTDMKTSAPSVIVPSEAVSEIVKIAEKADTVSIGWTDRHIVIEAGTTRFASKLIDGTFPQYRRVIPEGNSNILECASKAIQEAVSLVTAVSEDKTRSVRLTLTGDALRLVSGGGGADGEVDVDGVSYSGAYLTVGFNGVYLRDLMHAAPGDSVTVAFGDALTPAVVKCAGFDGWVGVVMPVRTN